MSFNSKHLINKQLLFPDRSKRTWTLLEQTKFTHLYKKYKKDFQLYIPHFDGRTESQIKSFYQNVVHNNKMIHLSRDIQTFNAIKSTELNINQNILNQHQTYQNFENSESLLESTTTTFENLDLM
ncbi:Conserved_hypothetical protein [Hexamita inflata]|uniref:Myb-like domain-containing protein n=1 Tax=Hexamita inflata TaxID=28002 RepID=A0AA86UVN5_9EUKA|nr:Conserved hypothetical protein [Hexamita inflata]